ncbi:hypothetical protein SEA_DEJAVU_100 [Microbacterium Phage DejaVu]|nr:hypothetical protein SEA_DEJAVU_100 [Microbacterium Phage DejaVu]
MTDIRKLAGKHARGFVDPKVKNAIVHALQEYQKSVVIDVLHSDPSTALVAERIVRNRPLPVHAGYNSVAVARITFKQLVEYAVEMGRQLERQSQPEREQEYGWEWAGNPSTGPHIVHGSDSKESAERAMEGMRMIAPVRIMARDKAVPGEWREA